MSIASGALYGLRYIAEVTYGVTPGTPVMKALRFLAGPGLDLQKEGYRSNEVRADRQVSNFRHGMRKVVGSIPFELSIGTYDDFLAAALSGAWTAVTSGAQTFSTTVTDVVRGAGSFITDGFQKGDIVTLTGFTQGPTNGTWKVSAVTATNLSLCVVATGVACAFTTETAAAGKTVAVTGKKLQCGTAALQSFTIEEAYTDILQFFPYRGVAINTFDLSIKPGAIVTGSFGLLGKDLTTPSGTTIASSVTAAVSNAPMDAFNGSIFEGTINAAGLMATITGMDLKLTNNRGVQGVVGSNTTAGVFEGQSEVSGTVTAFFTDATLFNKFLNETHSFIEVRLNDANGTDFIRIQIPNAVYTGGTITPPKDGPVVIALPFFAALDTTTGTNLIMQKSN